MSQELLKAWVHNVLQNPIDEHQLAHAQATKELLEENARYREALEKIQSLTFSWVINKHNAEDILLVVAPIREKCREALKGGE